MTTFFRPVRIRSQPAVGAPQKGQRASSMRLGGDGAGWLLTRMMLQTHELDELITDLQQQHARLPTDDRRPWRRPCWLEHSMPLSLVRGEYDAVIQMLSARRADLGRTYLPLMNALSSGRPAPAAVVSIIAPA